MNKIIRRIFWMMVSISLVACASPGADANSQTEAPVPSTFSPTSIPTSTILPATITPSPLPTQPSLPIITPDAIQVARWKEYEATLAKSILPLWPFGTILCEWDVLARSNQEVYVWAVCGSSKGDDSRPAVIHLEADGSVNIVEVPKRGSSTDVDRMFPQEVQIKFSFYTGNSIFSGRLIDV